MRSIPCIKSRRPLAIASRLYRGEKCRRKVIQRNGSIVFRHLSPAAFCKRLILTVDSTVNHFDHSEKSNDRKHLDRSETIEWE